MGILVLQPSARDDGAGVHQRDAALRVDLLGERHHGPYATEGGERKQYQHGDQADQRDLHVAQALLLAHHLLQELEHLGAIHLAVAVTVQRCQPVPVLDGHRRLHLPLHGHFHNG